MSRTFEAKNYRDFIKSELSSERFGRGGRSRLAEHLGVQLSFVSSVLGGDQDFSLEHGVKISEFLGLDEPSQQWLILLISRDRAGSTALKQLYQKQLDSFSKKRSAIQNRITTETAREVSEKGLIEYYSSWHHIAIHMALRNPKHRDVESLARVFKLKSIQVQRSLKLLEKIGFVRQVKGKWEAVSRRFHLGKDSPALRAHHTNWRVAAIRSLDDPQSKDLHFSSVMSIDHESAEKIRSIVLESIEKIEKVITPARDEELYTLNLDFFQL